MGGFQEGLMIGIGLAALCFAILYMSIMEPNAYNAGAADGYGYGKEPNCPGYARAGRFLREFMSHRWAELNSYGTWELTIYNSPHSMTHREYKNEADARIAISTLDDKTSWQLIGPDGRTVDMVDTTGEIFWKVKTPVDIFNFTRKRDAYDFAKKLHTSFEIIDPMGRVFDSYSA
jgi:hypothetical protein